MEVRELSIMLDVEHEEHVEEVETVTQEEVDYAAEIWAKHLTYLDHRSAGIPHDSLSEDEMKRLTYIMGRMGHQHCMINLPSKVDKPS